MARRLNRSKELAVFRVLLDEGVPVSVGKAFESRGYQAILHGDVLAPGVSDFRVAAAAITASAVLIAIDNDMKRIAGRYGSADPKYARLNLIKIGCSEPRAASRIRQAMSLTELEWRFVCEKAARRLYLEIGPHYIKTFRSGAGVPELEG